MRLASLMLASALSCALLFAQDNDPAVSISGGPPSRGWTVIYTYTAISGTDYPQYICQTRNQAEWSAAVTQVVDSSNTATVTTSAAHGLQINNRVEIAGVTGDTDLNGTYIVLTVPSSTTFTVTSASVTDATYNNAGITISSSAPRTNASIWAIKKYTYGGTGGTSMLAAQWAVRSGRETSGTGTEHSCDAKTTLAYQ